MRQEAPAGKHTTDVVSFVAGTFPAYFVSHMHQRVVLSLHSGARRGTALRLLVLRWVSSSHWRDAESMWLALAVGWRWTALTGIPLAVAMCAMIRKLPVEDEQAQGVDVGLARRVLGFPSKRVLCSCAV